MSVTERRFTVGKNVAAALHFAMWASCVALGYWLCWSNVLGDQAAAELEVVQADVRAKAQIDADHRQRLAQAEQIIEGRDYATECANMPIRAMRAGGSAADDAGSNPDSTAADQRVQQR